MSAKKYKQGKRINTIAEFDQSEKMYYIVHFGSTVRTRHRSFLMSLQYRTLWKFIFNGMIYEAERVEEDETDRCRCSD